jgi:hypothetical protein
VTKRVPIRGGNWNNGAIAGPFALNLNNARSNVNTNIGARPALVGRQKPGAYWAAGQTSTQKAAQSTARGPIPEAGTLNRRAAPVAQARDRSAPPPIPG